MSLADKKRGIFTIIGSYNSLMSEGKRPKQTDVFSSINSKDDVVPFVLDVLKTVAGTEALKEVIGGMFTKLIGEVEPKIKIALKKQFIKSNANEPIPSTPIIVPVKTIDVKGVFKTPPTSTGGNLIYGADTGFNNNAYSAILNNGTPVSYLNLSLTYDDITDSFQIKPSGLTMPTIGDFFSDFIDGTELINKKEIVSSVMDGVYGTLTKDQNKTVDEVYDELQAELLLQQLLDGDDSFVISPIKFDELLGKSREMVNGVVEYNMGCGLMPSELNFNDLSKLVSTISGSTNPFYIGNEIEATIEQSTSGNTSIETMTAKNKQTIKDGFFQKIIKIFTLKILQAVTTAPQIRVLLSLMSSLQNNGVILLSKAADDMKNFKTYLKCMAKEILAMVVEFIFAIAVGYLVALLKPVIKKVIKEKINQYTEIITSLTGGLSKNLTT